jgi:hypothetical protein
MIGMIYSGSAHVISHLWLAVLIQVLLISNNILVIVMNLPADIAWLKILLKIDTAFEVHCLLMKCIGLLLLWIMAMRSN